MLQLSNTAAGPCLQGQYAAAQHRNLGRMTPFRHFEPSSALRARRPPKITSSSCLRLCQFESKTLLKCCNCFLYCSLRIIEISRSHPKIKQFISLEAVIHCTFSRNESSMLLGLARIALLACPHPLPLSVPWPWPWPCDLRSERSSEAVHPSSASVVV